MITTVFASTVSDGAISAINYAWLVTMAPLGLFGMAISTAVFPTLAEQAVDRRDELRRTLVQSLRMILFLTIPASVGIIVLSRPLVTFLFERGEFDAASTDLTQEALVFYSIGLFAHAAIEILSRGFYALSDTRTPVAFAVVALAVNLVLSAALVAPLEVSGLTLGVSLATIANASLLFWRLNERLGGLDLRRLAEALGRTLLAVVLMAEVLGFYLILLHEADRLNTGRLLDAFLALAGGGLLGSAIFLAVARALRLEEVETLLRRVPWPNREAP